MRSAETCGAGFFRHRDEPIGMIGIMDAMGEDQYYLDHSNLPFQSQYLAV
jgi:hypothetical protein